MIRPERLCVVGGTLRSKNSQQTRIRTHTHTDARVHTHARTDTRTHIHTHKRLPLLCLTGPMFHRTEPSTDSDCHLFNSCAASSGRFSIQSTHRDQSETHILPDSFLPGSSGADCIDTMANKQPAPRPSRLPQIPARDCLKSGHFPPQGTFSGYS